MIPDLSDASCNGDREWVWTSTACVSTRYQLAHLKRTGLSRCFGTESELVTRCCGDEQKDQETPELESANGATSGNSSASTATTVLLVAVILVLAAVITIVVLVTRSKSATINSTDDQHVEIRPKPFEIFMEEKRTTNPLSNSDFSELGPQLQMVQMTNRDAIDDDDGSVMSDELMQAWASQRKARANTDAVWWIAPLPADVSVGANSDSGRDDSSQILSATVHDTPVELEWDEASHGPASEQPGSSRTYDNINEEVRGGLQDSVSGDGETASHTDYANLHNRGLTEEELADQLRSNTEHRKQFFEALSSASSSQEKDSSE